VRFYALAKGFLSIILKLKGYKVQGLENLPPEGPLIIASNHISLWDPIIVGCALPRPVFFMAKEELFKNRFFAKVLGGLAAFPVKRGQGDISAIRKSIALLKQGKILGIFPEGTRSQSGDIQEAMAGIVFIMEKSKAPILPIKVYGSKGLLRQKRGNIGVIIGKPICVDHLSVPSDAEDRRASVANQIMHVVNQM